MKSFLGSTVAKKVGVSITGLIMYGFVILHMLGNLKTFTGVDEETSMHKLDLYALFLRQMGEQMVGHGTVLWVTRVVLLLAIITHVSLVINLSAINKRARPVGYDKFNHKSATFASRSMLYSGMFISLFIIYHILHLTIGSLHPNFIEGQVFHNITTTFNSGINTAVYTIAVAFLGIHLYHGVWSLFQTLGLNNSHYNNLFQKLALLSGIGVFIGFAAVPVSIFLSLVGL